MPSRNTGKQIPDKPAKMPALPGVKTPKPESLSMEPDVQVSEPEEMDLEKSPDITKQSRIVDRKDGYYVVSEKKGSNLGGPYRSRKKAVERLRQVEYFKHKK